MRGTFSPGQVLYTRPQVSKVMPGDVVVFRKGDDFIVHRVTTILANSAQTRGDNNRLVDDGFISTEQIIGIVEKFDSGNKMKSVIGGRNGLLKARIRWGWIAVLNELRPVIGAPYRWLKASRIISKIWHPKIETITVQTPSGPMIKYIVSRKTIATWLPNQTLFICKRFYDLIVFPPK